MSDAEDQHDYKFFRLIAIALVSLAAVIWTGLSIREYLLAWRDVEAMQAGYEQRIDSQGKTVWVKQQPE